MTGSRHQRRLQILGLVLLLAGIGVGGFLYWRSFQGDADADEAVLRDQAQSRAYELAVQKNVGTLGLLMSRWSEQLGEPRAVAVEVALAAVLAAGICFVLAARPPVQRG